MNQTQIAEEITNPWKSGQLLLHVLQAYLSVVSQASAASERPQRCTTVEARVQGHLRDSWGLGVAPNWDRNKAFNYQKLSRLVSRGDEEEEAFVVVVYS